MHNCFLCSLSPRRNHPTPAPLTPREKTPQVARLRDRNIGRLRGIDRDLERRWLTPKRGCASQIRTTHVVRNGSSVDAFAVNPVLWCCGGHLEVRELAAASATIAVATLAYHGLVEAVTILDGCRELYLGLLIMLCHAPSQSHHII